MAAGANLSAVDSRIRKRPYPLRLAAQWTQTTMPWGNTRATVVTDRSALANHSIGTLPAPILKWVGGKSRLLPQLTPLLPAGVERIRHVEPFLGRGAMFFARRPRSALLSDSNPQLCATYRAVRDQLGQVIGELRALAQRHSVEHYYAIRDRYNARADSAAELAAMFVYLNKTCFNGLQCMNRRGEFNVAAGRYETPRIVDEALLYAASCELQSVELVCADFEMLVDRAQSGDFVYLDPPYEPVSATANFTAYSQARFDRDDQVRLRSVFEALNRRGCKLMLNNSDVPFVRELYAQFRADRVKARRAINCDVSRRGAVSEVVVRNY
jgi:DNA adenine methylase